MLRNSCILMIIYVVVIGLFSEAEAQMVYEDVIYLKNGSVIRGIILSEIPSDTLRVRTQGGSEFVYNWSDVLKITKEAARQSQLPTKQNIYIQKKSPGVALALSFLIVGGGQFYTENHGNGAAHLIVGIICFSMIVGAVEDNDLGRDIDDDDAIGAIGMLIGLSNWIYSIVTAPGQAEAYNEKYRRAQGLSHLENRLFLESYTSDELRGTMLSLRF